MVLLGLTGLYVAWKLAQRKGTRSIGLWIVILFSPFALVSSGVEWLTAQTNLTYPLTVEHAGSGSGLVRGGAIDCGAACRVSHGHGEFLRLKAISDEGSTFCGWLVNGDPYTELVYMQGDTVLTALFETMPNDAPTAVNDAYTTVEDAPVQVPATGLLSNDSDPNDDHLQAILVQAPSHGVLTLQPDGSFSYTPDAYFSDIDQFVYRVHDGDLDLAVAVVTITVNPVDNPPAAQDLSVETVIVIVDDDQGGIGGQQYSLTILPSNAMPTVTFIQPATGASIEEGRAVSLQVAASDSDGSITQVEFFVD